MAEEHLDEGRKTEEEDEKELRLEVNMTLRTKLDEAGLREIMRPTTHEKNRLRTGMRTKNRTQEH